MKGKISWSCVSCLGSEGHKLDIKLVPYDPGASFTVLWSYILPAKRRINIYTLCQCCLENTGDSSTEEQMNMILKRKNQQLFGKRGGWTRQQWNFWIPSLESQGIKDAMGEDQEIFLHLSSNAALPAAKY